MKRMVLVLAIVAALAMPVFAAGNEVFDLMGRYVSPTRVCLTTDTSASLVTVYNAAQVSAGAAAINWNNVRAVLVMATGANDAVISIGTAAVQGDEQVGYTLTTGSSVRFTGEMSRMLYIISKTSSSACRLQVTPEM